MNSWVPSTANHEWVKLYNNWIIISRTVCKQESPGYSQLPLCKITFVLPTLVSLPPGAAEETLRSYFKSSQSVAGFYIILSIRGNLCLEHLAPKSLLSEIEIKRTTPLGPYKGPVTTCTQINLPSFMWLAFYLPRPKVLSSTRLDDRSKLKLGNLPCTGLHKVADKRGPE